MIDKITIDYEGPDGNWLVIEDEEWMWQLITREELESNRIRLCLTDEACQQLDEALQPWREHQAEGERVRAEFEAHTRTGKCARWIDGHGPCLLPVGHAGEHMS